MIQEDFFTLNQNWINKYVHAAPKTSPSDLILDEVEKMGVKTNIFFVPIFNELFCINMRAYADSLPEETWTKNRHPSYPTTDVLLKDINFENIYSEVLNNVMIPLAIDAYELEGTTSKDYFFENFLVRYTPETQNHLPFQTLSLVSFLKKGF